MKVSQVLRDNNLVKSPFLSIATLLHLLDSRLSVKRRRSVVSKGVRSRLIWRQCQARSVADGRRWGVVVSLEVLQGQGVGHVYRGQLAGRRARQQLGGEPPRQLVVAPAGGTAAAHFCNRIQYIISMRSRLYFPRQSDIF